MRPRVPVPKTETSSESEKRPDRRTWLSSVMGRGARLSLILAGTFLALFPLVYAMPGPLLDDGWAIVLGEAQSRGWIFGRDVAFTGGPLSSLYTGYFAETGFLLMAALRLVLAAALARFLWLLLSDAPLTIIAALAVLLVAAADRALDAVFIAIPLLLALAMLRDPRQPVDTHSLSLAIFAAALVGLTKFSYALMALSVVLLLDLRSVWRRRPPLLSAAFILTTAALFAALEHGLGWFGDFAYYGFETTVGYADAMSFSGGNDFRLSLFLLVSLILAPLVALCEWARHRRQGSHLPDLVVRLAVIGLYWFFVWKAGFVRHDRYHEPAAWAGLGMVMLLAVPSWLTLQTSRLCSGTRGAAVGLLLILVVVIAIPGLREPAKGLTKASTEMAGERLLATAQFLADPRGWQAAKREARAAAWERVRRQVPLPPVEGSVDIISSKQSAVIAHGLDYRPRLTIQEYTTYTGALIEGNRRSLLDAGGPRTLLVAPESIDLRLPSLAEGPLWPDILRVFAPKGIADDLVVMERRRTPLPILLGPGTELRANLGEIVSLEGRGKALFLSLDIDKTLVGSALSLLLKPAPLMIEIETASGRRAVHRLIPAIAKSGFLISPYVVSAGDFLALANGLAAEDGPEAVRSFRVIAGSRTREDRWWTVFGIDPPVYRAEIRGEVREMKLWPLLVSDPKL